MVRSFIAVVFILVGSALCIKETDLSNARWRVSTETDLITDEEVIVLMRHASTGTNSHGVAPILAIRLTDYDNTESDEFIFQNIEIYIEWGVFVGLHDLSCMARVGDAEAISFELAPSSDRTATFFTFSHMGREGANMSFKVFLERQSQFIVRFTPYGENPITAVFELEGMLEAAEREGINTTAFLEWEGFDPSRARGRWNDEDDEWD